MQAHCYTWLRQSLDVQVLLFPQVPQRIPGQKTVSTPTVVQSHHEGYIWDNLKTKNQRTSIPRVGVGESLIWQNIDQQSIINKMVQQPLKVSV